MKIGILSRQPRSYSTRRLREAAKLSGHTVQVLDTLRFAISLEKQEPDLYYRGRKLPAFDAVIPRIGASITFYGLAVLRQFEQMGIYVPNESVAISRSRDKLRATQLFSRYSIGIPATEFVRDSTDLLPAIRRVGPELLELEARHPAIALRATRAFGDDAVRYLAKEVPSSDLPRLVGFAERADSPATRKLLLEAYRRDGPVILRKLDWKVVLATGLSAAMITGAHQVSDGIQDSLTTLASDHPGKVPVAIGALTSPLRTLARTIAVVVGLGILWQFRSQLRRLRAWSVARSKAPPSAKGEQP